jgi:hypothetical protein
MQDEIEILGAGSLKELLEKLSASHEKGEGPTVATVEDTREFLAGCEKLSVGDIVQWRPGMKGNSLPEYDQPAVVTQVLDTPVRLTGSNISAAERLDIGLGFMHVIRDNGPDNGKRVFADVLYDSRRFTKVGSICND